MTLLILLFILGIAIIYSIFFDRRIEETILTAVCSIIVVLYLGGLIFDSLIVPFYLLIICGIVCWSIVFYKLFTSKENMRGFIKQKIFTPGLLCGCVFFAWIWWLHHLRLASSWDEFSHWMLSVKEMYRLNSFTKVADSVVMFGDYPPGTALFQYFVTKLTGTFSEPRVYMAQGWLYASIFITFAKKYNWKNAWKAIASIVFIFVFPFIFNNLYFTGLYVDTILGIFFCYLIYQIITEEKKDVFFYLNMFFVSSVECLVKESGVFFVLIAAILLVALEIFAESKRRLCKISVSAIVFVIAIFVGKVSWSIYLNVSKIGELTDTSGMTLGALLDVLRGNGQEYQYTVLRNFGNALLKKEFAQHFFPMTFLMWLILLTLVFGLVLYLIKEKRKKIAIVWIIGYTGLILYLLGVLMLYLFGFSEYEAVNLASFARYISSYMDGLYLVCLMYIIQDFVLEKRYSYIYFIAMFLGIFLFMPFQVVKNLTIEVKTICESTREQRKPFDEAFRKYGNCLGENDKVCVVTQRCIGREYHQLRYVFAPIDFLGPTLGETYAFSFGEPYSETDIWTTYITPNEWLQMLYDEGVTHVLCYVIDERFCNDYGECFSGTPCEGLYKLKADDGELYLELIK